MPSWNWKNLPGKLSNQGQKWLVVKPTGEVVKVNNLAAFCRQNPPLNYQRFMNKGGSHGWSAYREEEEGEGKW